MKVAGNTNITGSYENPVKRQQRAYQQYTTYSNLNQRDNISFSGDIENNAVEEAASAIKNDVAPVIKKNKKSIIKKIAYAIGLVFLGVALSKTGAVDKAQKIAGEFTKLIGEKSPKTIKNLSSDLSNEVDKVLKADASLKFDQNYNTDGNLAPLFIPKEDRDYYSKLVQAIFETNSSEKGMDRAEDILEERGYKIIDLTKDHLTAFENLYMGGNKTASLNGDSIEFKLSGIGKRSSAYIDNKGNYAFVVSTKSAEDKYGNVINFVMHNNINDHIKNVIYVIRKEQSPAWLGKLDKFISNKITMLNEERVTADTENIAKIVITESKLNQARVLIEDINKDQSTLKVKIEEIRNLLYPELDADKQRLLGIIETKNQTIPVQNTVSTNQQVINNTVNKVEPAQVQTIPAETPKPVEVIAEAPKSVQVVLGDSARNANINAQSLTDLSVSRFTNFDESLKFDRNYNELPIISQVIRANNRDYYSKVLKVELNSSAAVDNINGALSGMGYSQIKNGAYKDPTGNFAFLQDNALYFIPHAHLDANIRFLNYQMRQNIEYAPDKLADMKEFLNAKSLTASNEQKTAINNALEGIKRITDRSSQQTEMTNMKNELYSALTAE